MCWCDAMAKFVLTFTDHPQGDGSVAITCDPPEGPLIERRDEHGDLSLSPAQYIALRVREHALSVKLPDKPNHRIAKVTLTFTDSPEGDGSIAVTSEPKAASFIARVHHEGDNALSRAEIIAVRCISHALKHAKIERQRSNIIVRPTVIRGAHPN